ncbi:hypothetical protein L9F63_015872 [Diploptera punctata]|uniref:Uncharacterized protein n=1 Tax=Diploptera punctata TaxID=6984 RepID=A0AAD8A5N1_DIPPU|nr:hypothetical protein L9F63_015872 [Diploptera punctata]
MSLKCRGEASTAPHAQLTGAGSDPTPPPQGVSTPRYIDDKDIRVLNNLLDDLKKLDAYPPEERLELATTGLQDEPGDGDVLLEHPRGARAEQVNPTLSSIFLVEVAQILLHYYYNHELTSGS